MQARTVDEMVIWGCDGDTVILIKEGGKVVWEGECRDIPKKYHRRYVERINMRCEVYIKGVPEVEYVTVTLFDE